MITDTGQLNFVECNQAWISYASDLQGTNKAWLCQVSEQHFATPDDRERTGARGYGSTLREAISNCRQAQMSPHGDGFP